MTHAMTRSAGLLIPLFSMPSTASWGIGDIGDLAAMAAWLAGAGQGVLQLLPLNEMAPGQQSPYSALSAMAIDPIYIRVPDVPEFAAIGGEGALDRGDRQALDRARAARHVLYDEVRRAKDSALALAFDRFFEAEWRRDTERARAFGAFVSSQAWWVDNYALYRAIHSREHDRGWSTWPAPLKRREPPAIDRARRELSRDILFHQYLQWLADSQWRQAREAAAALGVRLFGDLPFMVDGDSADVWARQDQFRLDVSLGVPPDAFSSTGQDWGMPVYRWDVIAADNYQWLRERARRSADLYDGYRVDHLVGFFRTYGRPRDGGKPFFTPAGEPEQLVLGERVMGIFREPGAQIIAEDLGTVPDFVREALARLGIPGFRVFRWEREWKTTGEPFRDPAGYPPLSVAASGTHDTETLATWWEECSEEDRQKVTELPTVRRAAGPAAAELPALPYVPRVRDTLLEALFAAGSNLLLFAVQDVFGWHDRINEPATSGEGNWMYRLPWPVDRLDAAPDARERRAALREWAERHGRWPARP